MRSLLILLLLSLTGCASAPVKMERPVKPDAPFVFNGRVLITQGMMRDGGGIHWAHGEGDEILLLGPLGYTAGRINRNADGATLEDAGGRRLSAKDAESLMQQALGWQLPLSGLRYWVTGIPAPEGEFSFERDAKGRITLLKQDGWDISYTRFTSNVANALPLQLEMRRAEVEVKLVIDSWEQQ